MAIHSSSISLGLLEGLTTVVNDVSGMVTLDVRAVGTTRDPHFDGRVDLNNAGFRVASSGSRYKNGQIALQLATDHVAVETFHLEDTNGDPLDLRGSLATHELRVSDLSIDVTAREFEVLHNEFGRMDVNARLQLRGQFESPRLQGRITVTRGDLAVDTILDRTMLRPYSVKPTGLPEVDAIAVLNPWDRLGLDVELHVPGNLRLVGDNVQVTSGTPLGPWQHQLAGARRSVSLQGSRAAAVRDRFARLGDRHLLVPGPALRPGSLELDLRSAAT